MSNNQILVEMASREGQHEIAEAFTSIKDPVIAAAGRAELAANSASANAALASSSASSAGASADIAQTTATALTTFLETKETLTAPAVDTTLSISGAAADSQVVGEVKHVADNVIGYGLNDVLTPANLYDASTFVDSKYMSRNGRWYTGGNYDNYDTSDYIRVKPGQVLEFPTDATGTFALANMDSIVTFDKNLNAIEAKGATNLTQFAIPDDIQYVRISIRKTRIGTKNAIYLLETGKSSIFNIPYIPENDYMVLGKYVNNLKWISPLDINNVSITTDSNNENITITVNGAFLTSDGDLVTINDTLTTTFPDSIFGVAIDVVNNKLFYTLTPTGQQKFFSPYYLAIWYRKKIIYSMGNFGNKIVTKEDGFIRGVVFAWISNNDLYLYATEGTRLIFNGLSQSDFTNLLSQEPLKIVNGGTGFKYVYYNGNSISIGNNISAEYYILGYVYQGVFYSLDDHILANTMPIFDIVQREDTPTYMNFERLGFRFVPQDQNANDNTYAYFGTSARITNAFNNNSLQYVWSQKNDDILRFSSALIRRQNLSNLSGKKILTVGDSITKRGYYQNYISQWCNATFVGTQTSNSYNIKCEGYSGMSAGWVLGSSGPFWNPNTDLMDFSYYCTTNQINPDIVTVLLGLNGSETPQEYFEYIQRFINSVKSYNPNITVYVIIPFGEAHAAWYGSGVIAFNRFLTMRLKQCQCYGLEDCTLIPAYYVMDDDTDYAKHSVEYGVGDLSFDVINDGVHPSENTGFKKLAYIIYNYLE